MAWGVFTARYPERFREHLTILVDMHAAGEISALVSAAYPLERAVDALSDMAQRRVTGKVVVIP